MRAGFPPGEAKENWAILRALSAELGATQPWDTLAGCAGRWWRRCRIWRDRHGAGERLEPGAAGKPGKGDFASR